MSIKELHSIKPFRGTDLGIIRLDKLAVPEKEKMKIMIGDRELKPKSFDTYGHPIISKDNFAYYKALKSIVERQGGALVPSIEYEENVFCMRRNIYDSLEDLKKLVVIEENPDVSKPSKLLANFKKMLICRKKAAFKGEILNVFVVFEKYVLTSNGHVYLVDEMTKKSEFENEVRDVWAYEELEKLEFSKEVHIPGEEDVCGVCGNHFTMADVKALRVIENEECLKMHEDCSEDFKISLDYQKASKIIDAVYDDVPVSEVVKEFDKEDGTTKIWYLYKTSQGSVMIRFKRKVIVIKWLDNFKPFNMTLFEDERVTKFDRGIHAWSKDDAIEYLRRAKKA